jgi:hypothetical protein
VAERSKVQSTGIQATRKTLIVTGGASITIAFIERGHIVVANSLDTTKFAVEPTGRLVDDEATVVTVSDGMTPHTTVLEAIKAANPIALGQSIHLPNSKRPLVERYPALCQSKIR